MFRSLRWRIQAWHALILAVVIAAFATVTYVLQRRSRMRAIDRELSAAVEVLVGRLQSAPPAALQELLNRDDRPGPGHDGRSRDFEKLEHDLRVPHTFAPRRIADDDEAPYFIIWGDDGTKVKTSNGSVDVPLPEIDGPSRGGPQIRYRNRDRFREAYAAGPPGTFVLVGRSIEKDMGDLRELLFWLAGTGAAVFLLGLGGGWWLSRRSVRPIAEISRVAADISEKSLSDRIHPAAMDVEFAGLAQTLNETFGRLESAFVQQVQFTADASHELRTPLSILQMHLELALTRQRTPEEYREAIQTCHRAAVRMSSLVESLLALARMDADGLALELGQIDLSAIIAAAIQDVQPLADAKAIEITADVPSTFVRGDSARLGQVMTNLLTNAVVYSPNGSRVKVTVEQTASEVVISVSDSGIGIPAEDIPHIFRRFYRVNKERSRDSGGSGLGLSICKTIVDAHGGTISVKSEPGTGSEFQIRLPRTGDTPNSARSPLHYAAVEDTEAANKDHA